jgi:AAA domain
MIRLRHLRLRSFTAERSFKADIPFGPGLNIIQAPNTSGKSTCLQAVIYVLGLERALGPQLAVPLPYAMRERIHASEDQPYELVLQSFVEMEVENQHGEIIVLHRDVVGGKDSKLIQVTFGTSLSEDATRTRQRDFYVLDGGSAVQEDGFHFFFASYLGWNLPIVARYDGTECPLYLETIFPMLFVEQKRGWSTIQGPFPTFFRIQDVARRVMEFLLNLDVARFRRQRSELRNTIAELNSRWTQERSKLAETAARIGRIRGLPQQPNAEFAQQPEIDLQLFHEGEWVRLSTLIAEIEVDVEELEAAQLETIDTIAPQMEERITNLRTQIDIETAVIEAVRNEHASETQDSQALAERIRSLEIDLRRNQDAQKLQRLGSDLGKASSEHVCPTCHQDVTNELLPMVDVVGMALDENIAFVKSQLELYRSALGASTERQQEIVGRFRGVERNLQDKQRELRTLRQELVRPGASPSRAAIENLVRRQNFLAQLGSIDDLAISLLDELQAIASEWAKATETLRKLPNDNLTPNDLKKVDILTAKICEQLKAYGFRSFQPEEIALSTDNFRPLVQERSGSDTVEKEINFEVSASDAIRLKWAYLIATFELKGLHNTNHPGLVIFDEPGQQEIDSSSLFAFLKRASAAAQAGGQAIISTSEPLALVQRELAGHAQIIDFPGFILQPDKEASSNDFEALLG